MALLSSPITYPPSSSPMESTEARKRPFPEDAVTLPKIKKRLFGRNPFEEVGQSRDGIHPLKPPRTASPDPQVITEISTPPSLIVSGVDEVQKVSQGSLKSLQTRTNESESALGFLKPRAPEEDPPSLSVGLTSSGKRYFIHKRKARPVQTYEKLIAERSATAAPGKATKSYYGVDIHNLLDEAKELLNAPAVESSTELTGPIAPHVEPALGKKRKSRNTMWTEKYRARKFTDLVGDERTHRTVLRWLKRWDPIVFPGARPPTVQKIFQGEKDEEGIHRKILLLTGPPGLGKTTLAHVCARQAGYEVVEINASDERSRDVVKGRIRDCVGTENVRGINKKVDDGIVREAGRPVCVVVDEVDGVVGGSGSSGEGGFMKALIDLVLLDQRNSKSALTGSANHSKGKKGDCFRLLRPMVLICNDIYHPALRSLRSSNLAEIIHVRKPPLDKIVSRMKTVFEKEGVQADGDGVRRLCEAAWGVSSRRDDRAKSSSAGEGDIRGVLVVGEWAARKLRNAATSSADSPHLTKRWVEKNMISDLSNSGSNARGIGRGGSRETAERIFMENAGFPKSTTTIAPSLSGEEAKRAMNSVSELAKGQAIALLRNAIDTCGDHDRVLSDAFTAYPSRQFQDDTFLSKPNAAYEWLHFHDAISSKVHAGQEWELMPYLSSSILGFHYLFSSSAKHSFGAPAISANDPTAAGEDAEAEPSPFSGPRADFEAREAHNLNRATLQSLQSSLSASLHRIFRSPEDLATEFMPQLVRLISPNVQPVVVGGSGEQRGTASVRREGERVMVSRAAEAMLAVGVQFERTKVEDERGGYGGFVYRMEPALDTLAVFETAPKASGSAAPARFAVRQVLDQEMQKLRLKQAADARQARYQAGGESSSSSKAATLGGGETGGRAFGKGAIAPGVSANAARTAVGAAGLKRDFFGRVVKTEERKAGEGGGEGEKQIAKAPVSTRARVWVTYHEGFSNAVRKPVSLRDLMAGL